MSSAATPAPRAAAADQPVKKRTEDKLGRANFAQAIARALVRWSIPESLVVSLMGSWGAGKTSVKNFIVDTLKDEADDKRPEVLEFNPWQITDREQLAAAFFRDVGLKLGRGSKPRNRDIADRWNRWAAALEMTTAVVDLWPKNLSITAFFIGFSAIGIGRFAKLESVFWVGVTISIFAAVVSTSARAARAVGKAFNEFDELSRLTLDELRESLKHDLAKLQKPLLIIIDDIDRLSAPEIKVVFQLVRAVSDFPRLIFLLIFERGTVERALADPSHASGDEYLEKIVQMPFFVPKIDQTRLQQVLIDEINGTLKQLPATVKFDDRRWWNMFAGGVNVYIDDLRDVYRYSTGFDFHATLFRSGDQLEVNPVDLLGVEALRLFEPELYVRLPQHENLLLQGPGQSYGGSDHRESSKAELDELLKSARKPDAAKRILVALFQQIDWLTSSYGYGQGFEAGWQRQLRICSPEIFQRYFVLAIPSGDISVGEVRRLITESADFDAFRDHLVELDSRDQLFIAIDRLSIHEPEIPTVNIGNVVRAVFDVGDAVPERAPITGLPAVWFIEGFASRLLKRIEDVDIRTAVLTEALRSTTGLYIPSFLVTAESKPPEEGERTAPLLPEHKWPPLHEIWRAKLRAAAEESALSRQRHLAELLFAWLELDDPADVRAWAAKLASTPSGATKIVNALTTRVRAQGLGDASARTLFETKLDTVEKFLPAEDLEAQISEVSLDELPEEERKSLVAFRRALKARREGRPADRLWREDDDED
jgi:predicted KAP-like P-loop ATPase